MRNILGISCYYHDSAACLVTDGQIVAAAQEERFTRKKHDASFPKNAIEFCLKKAGLTYQDIDCVAFYDKPFLKFERLLETYVAFAPRGLISFMKAMPVWIKDKLWISEILKRELPEYKGKFIFTEHHESHAASAFYASPFEEAAFLTLDGVGEWATTSFGVGKGNKLEIQFEQHFPHSLGLLYSSFTYYTGFKVNSGEYKVMGLAPYGEPKYVDLIYKHLIDVKDDGSFKLNMDYFDFCTGLKMTSRKFHQLFGAPPREPESRITQREMDLAASIQKVTEDIVLKIARHVRQTTGQKNLCMAGGVALNCVANGKILKEKIFDHIWIQPAAGDAGGALGAALTAWYQYDGNERIVSSNPKDFIKGSYLGPSFSDDEIEDFLTSRDIPFHKHSYEETIAKTARYLAEEKIIGWFQGGMEFGPRALGGRSILGDARSPKTQSVMNLKIKFRESFRPFAPSTLQEKYADWFDIDAESPYMLLVAPVKADKIRKMTPEEEKLVGIEKLNVVRSQIPAVTHLDYSARIQTVDKETNPSYWQLIHEFEKQTGCPVVVNTSFNVRGEPIVCTPEDAYRCFTRTHMDYLVLGNYIIDKKDMPDLVVDDDWKTEFALD